MTRTGPDPQPVAHSLPAVALVYSLWSGRNIVWFGRQVGQLSFVVPPPLLFILQLKGVDKGTGFFEGAEFAETGVNRPGSQPVAHSLPAFVFVCFTRAHRNIVRFRRFSGQLSLAVPPPLKAILQLKSVDKGAGFPERT